MYSPLDMYKEFFSHFDAGYIDAELFIDAFGEEIKEKIHERWIDTWLKGSDVLAKAWAIEFVNPGNSSQIKLLLGVLSDDRKTKSYMYYFPALLEKLCAADVKLSKELKPDEAQRIINGFGSHLAQHVFAALDSIVTTK